MSSVAISWGGSGWGKSADEIYRDNIDYLKGNMDNVINEVKAHYQELIKLDDCYEIKSQIEKLEELKKHIINNYTFSLFNSVNHAKWVNENMAGFNNEALNLKAKIKGTLLEIQQKIKNLHSIINILWNDIKNYDEFPEILSIKSKIERINSLNLQNIEELKNNISLTAEFIKIFKEVEKVNKPDGEGNLQNSISDMTLEAKNLKTSNIDIKTKLEKINEISAKLNINIKIYDNFSSEQIKNDDFSIKTHLEKKKKKQTEDSDKKRKQELQNDINVFSDFIKGLDLKEYDTICQKFELHNLSDNLIRLKNIRDEIKLLYGYLKEQYVLTEVYKEDINHILSSHKQLNPDIKEAAANLSNQKYILRKEYWDFYYKAQEVNLKVLPEHKSREDFLNKVAQSFEAMGYSFISEENELNNLQPNEIFEINTPFGENYKIHLRIDDEAQVITRFIKKVENLEQGEYEKQKDVEVCKKWCNSYREILAELSLQGIKLDIKMIKEPEEAGILYIKTDKKEDRKSKDFKGNITESKNGKHYRKI